MDALVYHGCNNVKVENIVLPPLKEGEARIRVSYAGICGSDRLIVSAKHPRAKEGLVLGHEFYGIIDEIKGDYFPLKKGDRVVCYPLLSCKSCYACRNGLSYVCRELRLYGIDCAGGMAQFCQVGVNNLIPLPNDLEDPIPVLLEPLAVAIHAIRMSVFKPGNTAAIIGDGPIGALIALVLKNMGAKEVIITGKSEKRLDIVKKVGVKTVNITLENAKNKILQLTNNEGCDIIYECAGSQSSIEDAAKIIKIAGEVVIVGLHKEQRKVDLLKAVFEELRIIGVRVYTKEDYRNAIVFARKHKDALKSMITQKFSIKDASKAFQIAPKESMKIIIGCINSQDLEK